MTRRHCPVGTVGPSGEGAGVVYPDGDERHHHSRRPASRRRPLRLRPLQGAPGVSRPPRRGRPDHPRHLAPQAGGQGHRGADPLGDEGVLRPARGLRGGDHQRWGDVLLGRGLLRPDRAALRARRVRRVLLQVRQVRRDRPAPGVARHGGVRGGHPPDDGADRGCRRLRVDPQRDLHRRDHAGHASGRKRPGPGRRDLRGRRDRVRPDRGRRLLLLTAEGVRRRGRPVCRPAVAGGAGAHRRHPCNGSADAAVPGPVDRAGQLRQGPDLQHAGRVLAVPPRRLRGVVAGRGWPVRRRQGLPREVRPGLRLGRGPRLGDPVRGRPGRPLAGGLHRRPRRRGRWRR